MNIEKTHRSNGLAPKPIPKSVNKKTPASFSESLKKAMPPDKSRANLTSAANEAEKIKLIKQRIDKGFYDRPENLDAIAEKLIPKGKIL
jgi:hypothetical protein